METAELAAVQTRFLFALTFILSAIPPTRLLLITDSHRRYLGALAAALAVKVCVSLLLWRDLLLRGLGWGSIAMFLTLMVASAFAVCRDQRCVLIRS